MGSRPATGEHVRREVVTGFDVLPCCRVVEPTFGCLTAHGRCARDYETFPDDEAVVSIAAIHARRFARATDQRT